MKIAICDDDIVFLKRFNSQICKCLSNFCDDYVISEYNNGKDCIIHVSDYDVVFLDIDMPEVSGLDIAGYINENATTLIVFVTEHDELVYSSLKFQPFRFLRKSYLNKELPEALNSLVQKVKTKYMTFKTKMGDTVIELNKLIYIEIFIHQVMFHIVGSEPLEGYGSLSNFEKILTPLDFIRVHSGYLVNCKFIYSIETNNVILDDKSRIPLSRHRAEKVKELFADYLRRCL